MRYTVVGKSLYDYLGIKPDAELEKRNEEITNALLSHLEGRETAIKVDVWGAKDSRICDGRYAWADLEDAIDSLAIKDGVDMIRFDNGNLGLVAYYNGRKSYLEFITDKAEVARLKETFREEDEE